MNRRIIALFTWAALLLLFTALRTDAQPGTLFGTVTDDDDGSPIPGATVQVIRSTGMTQPRGAVTNSVGFYRLIGLPPGTYSVTVSSLGYGSATDTVVEIASGDEFRLDIGLTSAALETGGVVVTASKRPEKLTHAPASISVVQAAEIEENTALSTAEHLRDIKGVDIAQGGLAQHTVVMRGFNNAFSGTLTMLTDNRIAGLPSLRYNAHYFIPLVNEDIEKIEIVRGPGSALYGPNASNGVVHLITRSPLSSSGTWFSAAAGERDVFQGMFRHAGTIGDRVGYKISGQYMRGTDWSYRDTAEESARSSAIEDSLTMDPTFDTSSVLIGKRDSAMERVGGEARIDWQATEDLMVILSTGATVAINNTDATGVGAAQARDWEYWYHQIRARWNELFVQAFLNRSDAGHTYLLRTGQPIVDRSTVFVAQVQHSSEIGERERLTYGADLILTNPVTDSTVNGRNEESDRFSEYGVYLQSETEIIPDRLDFVGALRLDVHSMLHDPILSPRAALVWTPPHLGSFRLTYNRAYNAPTSSEMNLDIVAQNVEVESGYSFNVRASGVPEAGFSFRYDDRNRPMVRSYLAENPERYFEIDAYETIWESVKEIAKGRLPSPGLELLVDAIPAPPAGSIETNLRQLNITTGAFDSYGGSSVSERDPVQPTINNTIEAGWQGVLLGRIGLNVDVYRSDYTNFVGPLETLTPTLFFDSASLSAYLIDVFKQNGATDDEARTIAGLFVPDIAGRSGDPNNTGLPIGNVSPVEAADPSAILLTYRNYGDITLYGTDIGVTVGLGAGLTAAGHVSFIDRNFFEDLDSVADLALNAPKFKFGAGLEYRSVRLGLSLEAHLRHVDGFPVRSGVYNGDVPTYTTVSIAGRYEIPWISGLAAHLDVQNLLTFVEGNDDSPFEARHAEFVGTPAIGRLGLFRMSYEF